MIISSHAETIISEKIALIGLATGCAIGAY